MLFLRCLSFVFFTVFITTGYAQIEYNLVEGLPNVIITPFTEKIGHTWEKGNVWDKDLINEFYKVLKENKDDNFVVIDLGAQTGSFSLLSKFFPHSTWHAFEPIEEAANELKENLLLNAISNVFVHQMAASDHSGVTRLKMPDMGAWGLSTLGSNVLRFAPTMEREIQCIDLDSFVDALGVEKVDFMKLDTEGWEFYILLGAERILMKDRPILLLEYNDTNMRQCQVQKEDLDEFLKVMGYECRPVGNEDLLCFPH